MGHEGDRPARGKGRSLGGPLLAMLLALPAAGGGDLDEDWVAKDLTGIEALMALMPIETRVRAELDVAGAGARCDLREHDLGFGARLLQLHWPHGYASTAARVVLSGDRVAAYEISVDGSARHWKELRSRYRDAWKIGGGPAFEEEGSSLTSRFTSRAVMDEFLANVARELGAVRLVDVPHRQRDVYDRLTSPFILVPVSGGPTGYAGVTREEGPWFEELVREGRLDVVESVLRSPNPQGQVYAVLALRKARDRGTRLAPETEKAMEIVARLQIPITTQKGCIGGSALASDVLATFGDRPPSEGK